MDHYDSGVIAAAQQYLDSARPLAQEAARMNAISEQLHQYQAAHEGDWLRPFRLEAWAILLKGSREVMRAAGVAVVYAPRAIRNKVYLGLLLDKSDVTYYEAEAIVTENP